MTIVSPVVRMFGVVSMIALGWTAGQAQHGTSAKALFHGQNPFGWVGIQYWLQTSDGTRVTERTAASFGGTFTLHIQSNTPGFLGVWTTADGAMLTPRYGGYSGHLLVGHTEYVVPGRFRPSPSNEEGRVVILFARSQTEMVAAPSHAIAKLNRLATRLGTDGLPSVVIEADDMTQGAIGTYVVNRNGAQPGTVIALTRAD